MQRYNPLLRHRARDSIESKVLGEFLHGYFENYASDEGLGAASIGFGIARKAAASSSSTACIFSTCSPAGSDRAKSSAAQRTIAARHGLEEQVNCTVRYAKGARSIFITASRNRAHGSPGVSAAVRTRRCDARGMGPDPRAHPRRRR